MVALFFQGFLLNAGLIAAVGAQNAFVIVQGLRGRFVFAVALTCAVCDTVLIGCGLLLAKLASAGGVAKALTVAGVVFLTWFGARSLRSAWRGETLNAEGEGEGGALRVVLVSCAFSLLNPHAILDMAVIFGGVAAGLDEELRLPFAAGGAAASFAWFFALGYGARKMSPWLARAAVWRAVNCAVAALMFAIAFALARDLLLK